MHPDLMAYLATVEPSHAIAWAALIPILISAISAMRGRGGDGSTGGASSTSVSSETIDPNMTAILDLQRRRMEMQNPLYEAVQRLAMGLMPTAYQQGVSPLGPPGSQPWNTSPGGPSPSDPTPPRGNSPREYAPWIPSGGPSSFPFTPDSLRRGNRPPYMGHSPE